MFGGPLYSLLKVVSTLRLAGDLTAAGADCVPVFWLATEDHDLAEVNHTTLLNQDGLPERLETSSQAMKDAPMSEVRFGEEISEVVERACALLGDTEPAALLRTAYRAGESFGTAFAKLFAGLFAEHGVILLDPADPELHAIAKPVYRAAIERAAALDDALLARGKELRAAGYHEQVKVTAESTLLFEKRDGARTVIHRSNGGFSVGRERVSGEELLARVEAEPQRFSANVLLRPVVQDHLLPTVAYFGGAAEIAYFAQLAVVSQNILGRVTPVLPRVSATVVDARAQRLFQKYGISLTDLFGGPDVTRELLASRSLPSDLQARFDRSAAGVATAVDELRAALDKLDPTLSDAAEGSKRKMLYQVESLRKRAAHAELRKNDEIERHAVWLSANLFPEKDLQEREIAGISFVARYGKDLIDELVNVAGNCPDHQVLQT